MMRSIRACIVVLAVATSWSCGLFDVLSPRKAGPNIVSVSLGDARDVDLTVGDTLTLVAVAIVPCQLSFCPLYDSSTKPERFGFHSEKPFVATIDSHGQVTAVDPGTSRLTASLDNLTSNAVVLRVSAPAAGPP